MYRRSKEYIKSGKIDPSRFIEGSDITNSELLYKIDNLKEYNTYTITKYEHRIDLIAREIYGEESYSWLLLYINRLSVDDLVRGVKLNYIPKDSLTKILSTI